jgi:hypothetical protein
MQQELSSIFGMCTHYESTIDKALLKKHFGINLPGAGASEDFLRVMPAV